MSSLVDFSIPIPMYKPLRSQTVLHFFFFFFFVRLNHNVHQSITDFYQTLLAKISTKLRHSRPLRVVVGWLHRNRLIMQITSYLQGRDLTTRSRTIIMQVTSYPQGRDLIPRSRTVIMQVTSYPHAGDLTPRINLSLSLSNEPMPWG